MSKMCKAYIESNREMLEGIIMGLLFFGAMAIAGTVAPV